MRILIDTNVVLDVLLDRKPHSHDSSQVFRMVEEGTVAGLLCATTVTTIDYLLAQTLSRADAKKLLTKLIRLFDIATVNRIVVEGALNSRIADFEDAVLDEAARHASVDALVTRNAKDFANAYSRILDPRQFLVQLNK